MKYAANCGAVIGMLAGAFVLFVSILFWLGYFNHELLHPAASPQLVEAAAFTIFGMLLIATGLTILLRYHRSYLFFLMEWAALLILTVSGSWSLPTLMLLARLRLRPTRCKRVVSLVERRRIGSGLSNERAETLCLVGTSSVPFPRNRGNAMTGANYDYTTFSQHHS